MDEKAPRTTAKKIDLERGDIACLTRRIVHIYMGEKSTVDRRVPSAYEDLRCKLYEQIVLVVRELIYNLNEEGKLGTDDPLPPAQVLEVLQEARKQAGPELRDLSIPRYKKDAESPHFEQRLAVIRDWLCANKEECLDTSQVLEIHRRHDIAIQPKELETLLSEACPDSKVSYEHFVRCTDELTERGRAYVVELFKKYAPSGLMKEADLAHFLRERCPNETRRPSVIINKLLQRIGLGNIQQDVWSIDEFANFLLNPTGDNQVLDTEKRHQVYQDMQQPLHHYFIASSHNSWLSLCDQLTSDSSHEILAQFLKKGCRLIELDCHDGPDGEPEVHLAWTKNKRISVRDCFSAIKENAFKASPFPVILSLQLHFGMEKDGPDQMVKMAGYMEEIFGDQLERWEGQPPLLKNFTPHDLKRKFLIMADKRPQEIARSMRGVEEAEQLDSIAGGTATLGVGVIDIACRSAVKVKTIIADGPADRAGINEGSFIEAIYTDSGATPITSTEVLRSTLTSFKGGDEVKLKVDQRDVWVILSQTCVTPPKSPLNVAEKETWGSAVAGSPKRNHSKIPSSGWDSSDEDKPDILLKWKQEEISTKSKAGQRYKRVPVVKELSHNVYLRRRRRENHTALDGQWWEVYELPEEYMERSYYDDAASQIACASRNCLIHVIPSKRSLLSQNPNPQLSWNLGAQMVGVHFQNPDAAQRLYQARFLDNGGCGYVLKPKQLRDESVGWNEYGSPELLTVKALCVDKLYVPSLAPCGEYAPYITARLDGVRSKDGFDTDDRRAESYQVSQFCREWRFVVRSRELGHLTLRVMCEGQPEPLAESVLPLNLLIEGLHPIPLVNPATGDIRPGTILCDLSFRPAESDDLVPQKRSLVVLLGPPLGNMRLIVEEIGSILGFPTAPLSEAEGMLKLEETRHGCIFHSANSTVPDSDKIAMLEDVAAESGDFLFIMVMECDAEEVKKRSEGLWLHKGSGRLYHRQFSPPKSLASDRTMTDDPTEEQLVELSRNASEIEEAIAAYRKALLDVEDPRRDNITHVRSVDPEVIQTKLRQLIHGSG